MTPLRTLMILAFAVVAISGTADAQTPEFPASWAGVWEVTTVELDCDTGFPIDSYTEPDTLCTGEGYDLPDEGFEVTCTGTITDTFADVSCGATFDVFPGCTLTYVYSVSGTRTGDTFTGTGSWELTLEGDCPLGLDECVDFQISGLRIGPEPPSCGSSPVLPSTWAQIKARYE